MKDKIVAAFLRWGITSRPECPDSSAAGMNGHISMSAEPKPYLAKTPDSTRRMPRLLAAGIERVDVFTMSVSTL